MQLYDRRVVVIVGKPAKGLTDPMVEAIRITGLRVTFKVEKSLKQEPNKLDLAIYNLGPSSRAFVQGKGVPVLVQAGYAEGVATVFSGDCREADSEKVGVDWITRVRCGDGERAYAYSRLSASFKPGAQVKQAVMQAVKALVRDPGNAGTAIEGISRNFASGYAINGHAAEELTALLEPEGLTWSVQDGRMQILKPGATTVDTGPLFSPSTGLVGSPSVQAPDEKGGPTKWKVKALLTPLVRPGQRFEVERTTGGKREQFRAERVTHTGDTHGGDWYTEIEATRL